MSQISPPIRILLVAVIGLCAAYFLFLRPKDETVAVAPPAATTPVPAKDPNATTNSKPGAAVQTAVKGADSAAARADQAAGGAITESETGAAAGSTTTTPTGTGVNTNPAAAAPATGQTAAPTDVSNDTLETLPKDVRKAVKDRKVLVMLFYNNRSDDDKAVRRELRHVTRYGNQVFIDAHWIKSVGKYQAITRGANVDQSPTVVVADSNLKAETLVGYVDRETIDQAVVDAIRASGGSLLKNPYYRKLDALCGATETQLDALPKPASLAALPGYIQGAQAVMIGFKRDAAAVTPAKRYRRFHKHFVDYATDNVGLVAAAQVQFKAQPADGVQVGRRLTAGAKKLDRRFV